MNEQIKVYRVTYLIKPSDSSQFDNVVERINAPDWQQASNEAECRAERMDNAEVIKLERLWTEN